MPAANKHLESALENFYRREAMHVSIFTFIDTYRFLFPSVSVDEAADAYMKRYSIDEKLYSRDTVSSIFFRVNKDLIELNKQKDAARSFPINSKSK